jgi:hypothetical protein
MEQAWVLQHQARQITLQHKARQITLQHKARQVTLQHKARQITKKSQVPVAMPVILATQEAEIRRIEVRSQTEQIVFKTLSRKTHHKKGLVEWLKV